MSKKLPTYSLHKGTGQARVWFNGKDHYLGEYGSEKSRIAYAQLITQSASGAPVDPFKPADEVDRGPTVNVIVDLFLTYAEGYYVKNGKQTAEVDCIRSVIRPLRKLFGDTPAKLFGPLSLTAVQQLMVESKGKKTNRPLCREFINKSIERIRRLFAYAVRNEFVPASVLTGLQTVPALEYGRTAAKDYKPRKAVPQSQIDAVKERVNRHTRDLIDLALFTGARPGELIGLTGEMIDRSEDVWYAVLEDHKMAHKGQARVLTFGPKSQEILRRYIKLDGSQKLFPISRKTFSDNIKRACVALKFKQAWTAHWLRHSSGTAIRKSHGLDATQATLGHASRSTTERYASPVSEDALQVARDRG